MKSLLAGPVVFSLSVLERVFHVKSCVPFAFFFIDLHYCLFKFITSGIRALCFDLGFATCRP